MTSGGAKLEDIFEQIQQGEVATLNLVLKADVTGSLEALTEALRKLEREDVKLSFVQRGVAASPRATSSWPLVQRHHHRLQRAARPHIASWRRPRTSRSGPTRSSTRSSRTSRTPAGPAQPEFEEVVTGEAEVRETFSVPGRPVAGCYVTNGTITRDSKVRFLRDGTIIWKGTITSLKRFKDDVREVQSGFECGIGLSDFQDLKQGDVIETFEDREIPGT